MRQSPIDIIKSNAIRLQAKRLLQVLYPSSVNFQVKHTPTTIQIEPSNDALVEFNRRPYKLLQIHFHRPSEHLIDGKTFDMECHLVHQAAWNQASRQPGQESLLVLGVNLEINTDKESSFKDILTSNKGDSIDLNLASLLPEDKSLFTYAGSLTTPGYDERVQWVVFEQPLAISQCTFDHYAKQFGENARPCCDGDCCHVFFAKST